jgi:hypothetical protein
MVAVPYVFHYFPRFVHDPHMLKAGDIVKYTARHPVYTGMTGEITWIDFNHTTCHVRVIAHPTLKEAGWLMGNVERVKNTA